MSNIQLLIFKLKPIIWQETVRKLIDGLESLDYWIIFHVFWMSKGVLIFWLICQIFFGLFFSVNREQWTYLERNREKQMKTWHLQNIFDRAAAVRKLLFENGLQTYKLILLSLWLMQSMNISFLQGLAFIGSLLLNLPWFKLNLTPPRSQYFKLEVVLFFSLL